MYLLAAQAYYSQQLVRASAIAHDIFAVCIWILTIRCSGSVAQWRQRQPSQLRFHPSDTIQITARIWLPPSCYAMLMQTMSCWLQVVYTKGPLLWQQLTSPGAGGKRVQQGVGRSEDCSLHANSLPVLMTHACMIVEDKRYVPRHHIGSGSSHSTHNLTRPRTKAAGYPNQACPTKLVLHPLIWC